MANILKYTGRYFLITAIYGVLLTPNYAAGNISQAQYNSLLVDITDLSNNVTRLEGKITELTTRNQELESTGKFDYHIKRLFL